MEMTTENDDIRSRLCVLELNRESDHKRLAELEAWQAACAVRVSKEQMEQAIAQSTPTNQMPMTTAERVVAIGKGLHGGSSDPNRCVCASTETGHFADTPHRHYEDPPYSCARCNCGAYVAAIPLSEYLKSTTTISADALLEQLAKACERDADRKQLAAPEEMRIRGDERARTLMRVAEGLRERKGRYNLSNDKILRHEYDRNKQTLEALCLCLGATDFSELEAWALEQGPKSNKTSRLKIGSAAVELVASAMQLVCECDGGDDESDEFEGHHSNCPSRKLTKLKREHAK